MCRTLQHSANVLLKKKNPIDRTAVFAIDVKPVALSELQTHHRRSVIHHCFDSCCAWDPHSGCSVSQANLSHLQWPAEEVAHETRQVVVPPNSLIKHKPCTPDYFYRAEWQCGNQRGEGCHYVAHQSCRVQGYGAFGTERLSNMKALWTPELRRHSFEALVAKPKLNWVRCRHMEEQRVHPMPAFNCSKEDIKERLGCGIVSRGLKHSHNFPPILLQVI